MTSRSISLSNKVAHKISQRVQLDYRHWSQDRRFFLMKYLAGYVPVREWCGRHRQSPYKIAQKYPSTSCIETTATLSSIVQCLETEGYFQGLTLPETMVNEFLDYAFSHPCYGDRIQSNPPWHLTAESVANISNSPFRVASYLRDQEQLLPLQKLVKDPLILAIAEAYLGHTPKYQRGELLWSFPQNQDSGLCYTHFFHCDVNDYRNIKFFFYLTDVDVADGPHFYIRGSHKQRSLLEQIRVPAPSQAADERFVERYGPENIVQVTGPAGFGFVGDPYTWHRGSDTTGKPRLLLQLEFCIHDYHCWYKG